MKTFFFLILVIFAGLFSSSGSGSPPGESLLRVGIHTFPTCLNPVYVTDETSQAVMNKIFSSLFDYDTRGRMKNNLAASCRVMEKGKKIIIELRKNIFFSKDRELVAGDVVETVKLLRDQRFKYPYIANISFLQEVKEIDRYTFSVKLTERSAVWRTYLTFPILNGDEIKNPDPENFRDTLLSGSGYYRIKKIKEPGKIVLQLKNPQANPSMYRHIEYIIVKNTRLAPLKLLKNEIDICELQPEHIPAYRNIKKWQKKFAIKNYEKCGYTYLVFNLKRNVVNENTRKFFYNVLIHGHFVDTFLADRGEKVKTPFLLLNRTIKPEPYNVDYPEKIIRLKMLTNSESKLRTDFVLFLRKELKPFNILIEPHFLEYQTFLHYLKNSRFDIALSAFLLEMDFDMKEIFYRNSSFNYSAFNNRQMDVLLDLGLREINNEKREKIYLAAHEIWRRELPLIPLFNLYYYMGISRKIKIPVETYNLIGSTGDFLYNIEKWVSKAD